VQTQGIQSVHIVLSIFVWNESNNHSAMNEMRTKVVAEWDNWKAIQIQAVMAVYNTQRQQVENVCEQNITEKWKVLYVMFEELNTISNTIEKKYTYKENSREYTRWTYYCCYKY
jgi:hypothetical protein